MSDTMFAGSPTHEETIKPEASEDLSSVLASLLKSRSSYEQKKQTLNALKICLKTHKFDKALETKVAKILWEQRRSSLLHIETEGCSQAANTILGLPPTTRTELTYKERQIVKNAIEAELAPKTTETDDPSALAYAAQTLESKKQVQELQNTGNGLLLELHKALEECVRTRTQTMPEIVKKRLEEATTLTEMNSLRIQLVEAKTAVDIFTDTEHSQRAYAEIFETIKTRRENCEREVQELEKKRDLYKMVDGPEFKAMAKTYIDYKTAIEKKKRLIDCLK